MPDGQQLYDYLDRLLCGWWLSDLPSGERYDWWDEGLKGQRGRWLTQGRMEFNPPTFDSENNRSRGPIWRWGFVFVAPHTGEVMEAANFARAFSVPAHRLIGKRTTPHTLRHIWATWAFQVGLTDRQLEALAFAMGHTVETLRKIYQRVSTEERTRPIYEAIDQFLFNELVENLVQQESPNLKAVIQVAQSLGKEDRQKLLEALSSEGV